MGVEKILDFYDGCRIETKSQNSCHSERRVTKRRIPWLLKGCFVPQDDRADD